MIRPYSILLTHQFSWKLLLSSKTTPRIIVIDTIKIAQLMGGKNSDIYYNWITDQWPMKPQDIL